MRTEYYAERAKPVAREFLPAAFGVIRNAAGELLLVRRADDGLWELPGGRLEVGESAAETVVREVAEETGVSIRTSAVSGVYSEPEHVLAYPDGGVYQQLAICFHASPVDGQRPRPDCVETHAAAWFAPERVAGLSIHPAMRRRIRDALTEPNTTHFN
jgi:8-oxo-dGTP pyrophosphatase MutT (NUDIX family)